MSTSTAIASGRIEFTPRPIAPTPQRGGRRPPSDRNRSHNRLRRYSLVRLLTPRGYRRAVSLPERHAPLMAGKSNALRASPRACKSAPRWPGDQNIPFQLFTVGYSTFATDSPWRARS